MYQIHFLYCVSNTLDADCHTKNRNGRSDFPFNYCGVNQQSERWIEKLFWRSIDVWCLAVKRSKWCRNRECLCFCGLWMSPVPAHGKSSWNEKQGTRSFTSFPSWRGQSWHCRTLITLVGVMLTAVGGCSCCHTGVTGPVSPLTQLLSLQAEMDLGSALSVDGLYTRGVKEKWMTFSITNSHKFPHVLADINYWMSLHLTDFLQKSIPILLEWVLGP